VTSPTEGRQARSEQRSSLGRSYPSRRIVRAPAWTGKPTIFEFYVLPAHRGRAFHLFDVFLDAYRPHFEAERVLKSSGIGMIEVCLARGVHSDFRRPHIDGDQEWK
jgi:hypothetical protein